MRKFLWTILISAIFLGCLAAYKPKEQKTPQQGPITAQPKWQPVTKSPLQPQPEPQLQPAENTELETEPQPVSEKISEPNQQTEPNAEPQADDQEQIQLDKAVVSPELERLLKTYVDKSGLVNYQKLRRKRGELIVIEKQLKKMHPVELISFTDNEKMAFWINSYNTFIIKLIIDNYPIDPVFWMPLYPKNSVMQLHKPWTKHFFEVMDLEYTLWEIEFDLLLQRFADPRIGFALSRASIAAPPLLNEPYRPEKLDEQLDRQVKNYLMSPWGMKIDHTEKTIYLSVIFKWYKKLFIEKYGEIKRFRDREPDIRAYLNFIIKYIDPEDAKRIQSKGDYKVEFIRYNWALNEQPKK